MLDVQACNRGDGSGKVVMKPVTQATLRLSRALSVVLLAFAVAGFAQGDHPQLEWTVHQDADVSYQYPKKWVVLQDGNPTIIADAKQIEYNTEGKPRFLGEGLYAGRMLAEREALVTATDKIIELFRSPENSAMRKGDQIDRLIDGIPGLATGVVTPPEGGHEQEHGVLQTLKRGDFVYYWWYFAPKSRSTAEESIRQLQGVFTSVHFTTTKPPSVDAVDVAKHALESLVLVEAQQRKGALFGSGFAVDSERVVTNSHVCPPSTLSIVVSFASGSGKNYRATVIGRDENNDLLILRVPGLNAKPLQISSREPSIGEPIFVAGNPEGLEGSFSTGNVAAVREFRHTKWIQITAPISHGSSGGPVMDGRGLVIGVTVANLKEGQNLNFAIPGALVAALLLAAK